MDKTSLGDRMKMYEKAYSRKAMPLLPVIARLDGRAFHSWCRGLDRPFDKDFMSVMQKTTELMTGETGACIGYTQSDEITLIFYSNKTESQIFFDGKLNKMTSVLASMCTAFFNKEVCNNNRLKDKPLATFDCRVFQVPTLEEAVNCLIWREQDATRNSILSVAQSKFSHKEMNGKNTKILQEMMFQKDRTNWSKDFTSQQKRGSYYQRVVSERQFTTAELKNLPPMHDAHKNPGLVVRRTDVKRVEFPPLSRISNRVDVVFYGADPVKRGNQ